MPILPTLSGPSDLRRLTEAELEQLATEIRETIIATVATTGGHLGSSLGVVELTIALHRLLESPRDRIVWDTGHQAYPHKLLTGRFERFGTLRSLGGVGGFPRRSESEHDVFDGGHAGTGLSIGQGLATARDLRKGRERIAVVVGDAAITSGLSLEALNDIGQRRTQLLIVLNDNEMSISPTVGGLSKYLSQIKLSGAWQSSKNAYDELVGRIPGIGPTVRELSQRLRASVVNFAQDGRLFEDLGITYIGLVPGHDLKALLSTFQQALELKGPVVVHVRTQKGRGFRPAEADQIGFHGAALPPIDVPAANGMTSASVASDQPDPPVAGPAPKAPGAMPTETMADDAAPASAVAKPAKNPNYTAVFAKQLIEQARTDPRIVAITAGMPTGTGLSTFQAAYPERFIDVGIAEQHSVALATGLAMGGMRPVVALYSTFLQRAFDQTVHDVCQNDQPVLIAVDRAGLVGEDGTSHQGMFTLPAQRQLPNLVIASPKDEQELRSLLVSALSQDRPFALHYPRDPGFGLVPVEPAPIPVGRGEVVREGSDLLFVGFGPIVARALEAAEMLASDGWSTAVINARFAKPLDRELILSAAAGKRLVVTFEESVVTGGFGAGVLEAIEEARLGDATLREVPVRILGIPGDAFVDHGSVADLRRVLRLDSEGLAAQVRETLTQVGAAPPGVPLGAVAGS
ncbi:MAG TPA: 1-deoxy-D-xylulose-5-phosphate synthase [Candidatus Limnocylindrales bacterium]|nr:1-deoxy-D-xylulose-5-phosphate synthase [Candidatus Limnocylindrales bacterium]